MTTIAPPYIIDGPKPLERPFGIHSVVDFEEDDNDRWVGGAQVYSYPSDLPQSFIQCSEFLTSPGSSKDEGNPLALPVFDGFAVYFPETCTSRGIGDTERFKERARIALDATEDFAVEQQLATGYYDRDIPYFTDGNMTRPNLNTPVGPTEALALLEDAIGATGRGGVIHATPGTVTAWSALWLVYQVGDHLRTTNGTPVVAGAGYLGANSVGHPATLTSDEAWAFATGNLVGRRSGIFMNPEELKEAMDRSINRVTYRAERYYLAAWDTHLQAGVIVDRSM